jgi:hypothetical protein
VLPELLQLLALQRMRVLELLLPLALSVIALPDVFVKQIFSPLRLTLPTLGLAARPPSVAVLVPKLGGVVPLSDPATPHPPPVHSWSRPLVSTISALLAKAVDGVQGPIVGAMLVMLKLITQPPAVLELAPQELPGTAAKSQSLLVFVL